MQGKLWSHIKMIKLGFSGAMKLANEERERAMQTGWVRFFNGGFLQNT